MTPLVTSGRATSCTRTDAAVAGTATRPSRTELARVAPPATARGDLVGQQVVHHERRAILVPMRDHADDAIDPGVIVEDRQRRGEQRAAAKAHERLRPIRSQAVAGTGAHEDRPGLADGAHSERRLHRLIMPRLALAHAGRGTAGDRAAMRQSVTFEHALREDEA